MKKLTAEQIQMNWETLMDVINKHIGYNHGYYFIQSFIESHFNFHSEILK